MKKALVILILLAFVGGGLFAQEGLVFSGYANSGIGMWKEGDNDPGWGLVARAAAIGGARAHLQATYTHPDRDRGFVTRIRASGTTNFPNANLQMLYGYGWFTAMDGLIRLDAGRIGATPFGYGDWVGLWDPTDAGYGVQTLFYPVENIRLGFGAVSTTLIPAGEFDAFTWNVGFRADMPFATLRGFLEAKKEMANLNLAASIPFGSFNFMAATHIENLIAEGDNTFGDVGIIRLYPYVSYSGITNLSLNVGGVINLNNAEDDPYMNISAYAGYTMGNVIPSIAVVFGRGGVYNDVALRAVRWGTATYNADDSHLSFHPSVRLRTTTLTYVDIGGVIDYKIGDNAPDNPLNIGAYVSAVIQF